VDDLLRHPIVATLVAGLALALLLYIAGRIRTLSKMPEQVAALDHRLTVHLAQEEKDNKSHAAAVTEVHERIDELTLHLLGKKA
jgi:hypothetical protein